MASAHDVGPSDEWDESSTLTGPCSTLSADGHRNLAPHSYFNLVADIPPHIAFSLIGFKDTLRNIHATGEFVVNLASRRILAALDASAASLAPDEDEFEFAGVTPVPARRVRSPRVAPDLLDPVVRLSRRYGVLGTAYTPEEEPSPHVLS